MHFTTKVPIINSESPISYDSQIVSVGSCFAENMGEKFDYFKFRNMVNPFGIIFNPVSIEKLIIRSIQKEYFTEKDVFFHNERWHCFEVHSELSCADKEALLLNLNRIIEQSNHLITEATHVIITYGTSWVYRYNETDSIVANCHKVPQRNFAKEILSVPTIEKSIENTINAIRKVNADCQIIFTVSPVRHIKDGFVENQRSKAHLITAIHSLSSGNCYYFPSYEIMMDELRDYRFYGEDMLHPNSVAINYIWERFVQATISEISLPVMKEVDSVQKDLAHRTFNPTSESHQKFLQQLSLKIDKLHKQFPFMEFELNKNPG